MWLTCDKVKNCETTCGRLYKPCTQLAIRCSSGRCQCRNGYARDPETSNCVPVSKCSDYKSCPKNEVYLPCGQALNCETTCGSLFAFCDRVYKKCPEGCQCKEGYARDPVTNLCKPITKCEDYKPCPKNEEYQAKGFRCLESCDETLCARSTEMGGNDCFCKKGFVRISGECVPKSKCQCPKNMVWSDCGSICSDKCNRDYMPCPEICKIGCLCKEDYAMINDICQPRKLCNKMIN